MKHEESSWKTADGLTIYAQSWLTEEQPKVVMALVHGMGEHSGRYDNLIQFLNERNIAVLSFDHRGHGKSKGQRGHTPSLDLLLDDIGVLLERCREKYANVPLFLFGHSLGGNLVLNYVMRRKPELTGLIVSAPWLKLINDPPAIQLAVGKFINNFFPSFSQSTGLDNNLISRDPNEVEKYMNDKLIHSSITSNFFLEVFEAAKWAYTNPRKLSVQTLLYHSKSDSITSYKGSSSFAARADEKILTFKSLEEYFHEAHNDKGKEEVFDYIYAWIELQLEKAGSEVS